MAYKTILVHLDRGERRAERLRLAIALAERFDAHLIGMFALDIMRIPSYAESEAAPIITAIEKKTRDQAAQQAAREFNEAAASRRAKTEWRTSTGEPVAAVTSVARYADLVVVGQSDPEHYADDCVPPSFAEDVVLETGKAVLVVPFAGHFDDLGKRAVVAWKPTREASRALWDALPMLERGAAVEVVSVERAKTPSAADDDARRDIAGYLERHGVNAEFTRTPGEELGVGEVILSRAADFAADLIVMGAYGHSRLRERVFGGATRTVLDSMTVPVLMSN